MSLSCCILILLLLILFILPLPLVRLLVLSLSLVWCSCSFCICHFSYLYALIYTSFILKCCILVFVNFPALCLLFSKFNLSQMLEFDDSWKLITARILSGIIPDEKPFINFLSFFCFSIAPGDSNTSILIPLTNLSLFLTIGDLSFLFLRPWMSPHVMYGSAMCS